jgi:hypothetical protein
MMATMRSDTREPWPVTANLVGTVVFCLALAVGVPLRAERVGQVVVIVVSMVLFAIGTACAIWAYALALDRSRTHEIGVANLFLLTGATATPPVKRLMWGCLGVQVLAAVLGASIGVGGLQEGDLNALAFGTLVPMFAIGLNGMYAVRHGAFGPRLTAKMPSDDEQIG